jgi:hypothetical protein
VTDEVTEFDLVKERVFVEEEDCVLVELKDALADDEIDMLVDCVIDILMEELIDEVIDAVIVVEKVLLIVGDNEEEIVILEEKDAVFESDPVLEGVALADGIPTVTLQSELHGGNT